MAKKKKQVRNNFRDRLSDYYRTNREITKEFDAKYAEDKESGSKRPWTSSEKAMLIITLVALVALVVKFLVFN